MPLVMYNFSARAGGCHKWPWCGHWPGPDGGCAIRGAEFLAGFWQSRARIVRARGLNLAPLRHAGQFRRPVRANRLPEPIKSAAPPDIMRSKYPTSRSRMASCPHALPAPGCGKSGPNGVSGSGLSRLAPIRYKIWAIQDIPRHCGGGRTLDCLYTVCRRT